MKYVFGILLGILIVTFIRFIFRSFTFKSTLLSTILLVVILLFLSLTEELGENIYFLFGSVFAGLLIITFEKYNNFRIEE